MLASAVLVTKRMLWFALFTLMMLPVIIWFAIWFAKWGRQPLSAYSAKTDLDKVKSVTRPLLTLRVS